MKILPRNVASILLVITSILLGMGCDLNDTQNPSPSPSSSPSPAEFTEDVTITMQNIPSEYKYARLDVGGNYSPGNKNQYEWIGYSSNKATVSSNNASLVIKYKSSDYSKLQYCEYRFMTLVLYGTDPKIPLAFFDWSTTNDPYKFLVDATISTNTTYYPIRKTCFCTPNVPKGSFERTSPSVSEDQEDGSINIYQGYTESEFASLKTRLTGNNTLEELWRLSPLMLDEKITWTINPASLTWGTITNLPLDNAQTRALEIQISFCDFPGGSPSGIESLVLTPTGSNTAATVYSDITNMPLWIARADWEQCVESGFTLHCTNLDEGEYEWTVQASGAVYDMVNVLLSYDDARVIKEPRRVSRSTTISIASAGTHTIDLSALLDGSFTPTTINLSYTVRSSNDMNLDCIAYISSGPVTTNYNLVATKSGSWWGASSNYIVTGGTGTTYENNVGGVLADATLGIGTTQCTKTVSLPLTAYSINNADLVITSVIPANANGGLFNGSISLTAQLMN